MSMSVSTGSNDAPMCDVNTTPLIDVMLVMLVMLIITLPIQTHAVKLDMPRDTHQPPPEVPPEVIDIGVDYDGVITWNEQPATLSQIETYFKQEAQLVPQKEIHLRPDRRSRYDVVANVLASAQRNRMVKIGFVNVSQFRD